MGKVVARPDREEEGGGGGGGNGTGRSTSRGGKYGTSSSSSSSSGKDGSATKGGKSGGKSRRQRRRRTEVGMYSCEFRRGMTCCSEWGDDFDDKVCCVDEKKNDRGNSGRVESNDRVSGGSRSRSRSGGGGGGGGKDDDDAPDIFLQGVSNGQVNSVSNDYRN